MLKQSLMKPRPDWNRQGPNIPCWFHRALHRLDKDLVLQFVPPATETSRGVSPEQCPQGVWNICRKLPRTGLLHPCVVWSLVDSQGNYASPSGDTIRFLRSALGMLRAGRVAELEREVDIGLEKYNAYLHDKSRQDLEDAIVSKLSAMGHRNFQNRVFLRRDVA